MRKTEKLIVLAVLFAAAIVLAISLNRGRDETEASGPLSGAAEVLGEDGAVPALPASDEVAATQPSGAQPSLLLDAGAPPAALPIERPPAAPESGTTLALEPASDASARILMDTNALRPSFLDNFMVYTVVEGDTWSGLSQRFYQDGRYTRNLHLANEELVELVPGDDILVPVYDFIAVDAGLQRGSGTEATAASTSEPVVAPPTSLATAPEARPAGSRPVESAWTAEYEVKSGDTLSDISRAVFGSATRWQEILEANRDKLQKPESLQVGMKLRVPEGGKLVAAAKDTAKKTEAKPKAAPAASGKATSKKKVL